MFRPRTMEGRTSGRIGLMFWGVSGLFQHLTGYLGLIAYFLTDCHLSRVLFVSVGHDRGREMCLWYTVDMHTIASQRDTRMTPGSRKVWYEDHGRPLS